MSKGNLFMGFGRGKVGSVVLARSKGQQVARAYNDAPKNPRSEGQMLQRSLFASAVKFFTQGRQAFYQFAFENKSSKQSDYNAFVSANAKRGMNISKAAFEEATYPVLAPWMMSKGSLPELDLEYVTESTKYKLSIPGLPAMANMGRVSKALMDVYGLNAGDIITVVTINAQGSDAANTPDVAPAKRQLVKWDIKQAVIDIASTDDVSIIFGTGATAESGGITFTGIVAGTTAGGASVTISRVTEEGLKVNDSYLVLNAVAETIYAASKEEGYIDEVLVSWKSTGKSILEGSLLPTGPATIKMSKGIMGDSKIQSNAIRFEGIPAPALYGDDDYMKGTVKHNGQTYDVVATYYAGDTLCFTTLDSVSGLGQLEIKNNTDEPGTNIWTRSSEGQISYVSIEITEAKINGKTYIVETL